MTTTTKPSNFVIDGEHVAQQLNDIREKLATEGPEVLLDFFLAQALDPTDLRALEELAASAEGESTKIVIRGINIEMYKVLKLAGLSEKFEFID